MPINLPILPIGLQAAGEGVRGLLPVFYMGDYSVMALLVGDYRDALRVLAEKGVRISQGAECGKLLLDDRRQIPPIVELLNANGVSCAMADAVDGIYQG